MKGLLQREQKYSGSISGFVGRCVSSLIVSVASVASSCLVVVTGTNPSSQQRRAGRKVDYQNFGYALSTCFQELTC